MNLDRFFHLYQKTLKRVPGLHRLFYELGEMAVLPILESVLRFRTPNGDPFNFRLRLLLNQWEPETVAFFKKVIRRGDLVLDIGAHVGYYTRLFSKLIGNSGRVVAVEPHPDNFRLLKANTQRLSNVTLLNVAAAEKEGEVVLYDAIYSGNVSIKVHENIRDILLQQHGRELSKRLRDGFPVQEYKVSAVPLDKVFPTPSFRIAKMDIEGAECLAIKGMPNIMSKLEILVFELSKENLTPFGFAPADLLDLIEDSGLMHFYLLNREKLYKINRSDLISWANSLRMDAYENVVAARYPL